jgi:hypothetical protein
MSANQSSPAPASPDPQRPETGAEEPTTTQVLSYVLQRAASAHHFHELELGHPHADWPPWYAGHMAQTLADHGYRLVLADDGSGVDVTADPTEGVATSLDRTCATSAPCDHRA